MKQRRGRSHPRIVDVTHNLCPWCKHPFDVRIPVIGEEGCDWAYGHSTGDEFMFHFSLDCTGQEDPEVMNVNDTHDYMYQGVR